MCQGGCMRIKYLAFLLASLISTTTLAAIPGLRDDISPTRLQVGAAASAKLITSGTDTKYASVLAHEYNLMTPENDLKWGTIHPRSGTALSSYNFAPGDTDAKFALSHGMHMRGHTLFWARYNPSWLTNGNYSATQLTDLLTNHIQTVMTHYKQYFPGLIVYWDVINEIKNAGSGVWAPIGNSFKIASIALQAARKADPSAKLCLNEYSMEFSQNIYQNPTYLLAKQLKQANIPLDCVGFQGHIGSNSVSETKWRTVFSAFAALGLEVQVTEFDAYYAPSQQYTNVVKACLSVSKCSAFVTWGFTDKYTWLGTSKAPLPFDAQYNKKSAYTALANSLLGK